MKKIDTKLIEDSIKNILIALGDNPDREGLKETPKRVARMYEEVFRGMTYSNDEIAKMYGKCFEDIETNDLVVVKDIPVFSYCEHHMALMYNAKIHVAYIPKNKVIGLSKIARIADMVCRRLQLQERICTDIADILEKAIGVENIMVVMEGEHSCMTARGIAKPGVSTKVSALRGMFKTSESLRKETYDLLRT